MPQRQLAVPLQGIGGLFAMSVDAAKFVVRGPFQWREFLDQSWFVARVSMAPTLLVAIPFTVLVSFTLNILLRELGAADLSGAGAAFGAVTQVGPMVTVLIVAGAGATAMCVASHRTSTVARSRSHRSSAVPAIPICIEASLFPRGDDRRSGFVPKVELV